MFELIACFEFLALAGGSATLVVSCARAVTWWRRQNFERKLKERLSYLRRRIADTVEHKVTWQKKAVPLSLTSRLNRAIACRDLLSSNLTPTEQTAAQLDRAIDCVECAAKGVIACENCSCTPGAELPDALAGFELAYGSLPGVMEVSEGRGCIKVVVGDRKTFDQMPRHFACQRVQAEMYIDTAWSAKS